MSTNLHESGLTVNLPKCEFNQSKIELFGYIVSKDGISPDHKKVKDLKESSRPQNQSEVRSFLGMAQYSSFPDSPQSLNRSTSSPDRTIRGHGTSRKKTRSAKSKTRCLNPQQTHITTRTNRTKYSYIDASSVGIAAILTQDCKPVAYASRSLTDVERGYSQTEREALAVVWGCEHFNIFTYGAAYTIGTDHRPRLGIWQKPDPPLRIARWALRLQHYDIRLQYRCGRDNPADYMSRHPAKDCKPSQQQRIEEFPLMNSANL